VDWPTLALDEIIARLNADGGQLRRVCVGMITHRRAFDDMNRHHPPLCDRVEPADLGAHRPTLIGDLGRLAEIREAGADMIAWPSTPLRRSFLSATGAAGCMAHIAGTTTGMPSRRR